MFKVSYPYPSFRETYTAEAEHVQNHISKLQWAELTSNGTVYIGGGAVKIEKLES